MSLNSDSVSMHNKPSVQIHTDSAGLAYSSNAMKINYNNTKLGNHDLNKIGAKKKKNKKNVQINNNAQLSEKSQDLQFEQFEMQLIDRHKISAKEISSILLATYDIRFDGNLLFYYNGSFWESIPNDDCLRRLRSLIPTGYDYYVTRHDLLEVYEWLTIDAGAWEQTYSDDRYRFINFEDCAVDFVTDNILNDYERKEKHFKYSLTIPYKNCCDDVGSINGFLKDIFSDDPKTIREFSKFFALAVGDYRTLKKAFIFFGPPNSGKSVMLRFLGMLAGKEQFSSISFSQFGNDFAPAQLLGKRLNLSSEISGASNDKLDIFKSLSGHDTITTCFKYKGHFQFTSDALLVFAGNIFPHINNPLESASVMDRFIIFPFNKVVKPEEWIGGLDYMLYQDLQGTIDLIRTGVKALIEDGGVIRESDHMLLVKKYFREDSDSFGMFVQTCLSIDKKSKISSRDINDNYVEYCNTRNLTAVSSRQWAQMLVIIYPSVTHCTMTVDGKRVRGYKGIRLKVEED